MCRCAPVSGWEACGRWGAGRSVGVSQCCIVLQHVCCWHAVELQRLPQGLADSSVYCRQSHNGAQFNGSRWRGHRLHKLDSAGSIVPSNPSHCTSALNQKTCNTCNTSDTTTIDRALTLHSFQHRSNLKVETHCIIHFLGCDQLGRLPLLGAGRNCGRDHVFLGHVFGLRDNGHRILPADPINTMPGREVRSSPVILQVAVRISPTLKRMQSIPTSMFLVHEANTAAMSA